VRTLTKLTIFFIFLFSVKAEAKLFIPSVSPMKPKITLEASGLDLKWEKLKLPYLSDQNDKYFNLVLKLAETGKKEQFFRAISNYKKRYPSSIKRIKKLEILISLINEKVEEDELLSLLEELTDTPRSVEFNTQLLFSFVVKTLKNTNRSKKRLFENFSLLTEVQKVNLIKLHVNSLVSKEEYSKLKVFLERAEVKAFPRLFMNLQLFTKLKREEDVDSWLLNWRSYKNHLSNENLFNLAIYSLNKGQERAALSFFNRFLSQAKEDNRRFEARLLRSLIIGKDEQLRELESLARGSGYIKERAELYLASLGRASFPRNRELTDEMKLMRWASRMFSYQRQNDPKNVVEYGKMLPLDKMSPKNQRYFKDLVEKSVGIYFAQLMVKEDFSHIFRLWEKLENSFEFKDEEKIMVTLAAFKTNHLIDLKSSSNFSSEKFNLAGIHLPELLSQLSRKDLSKVDSSTLSLRGLKAQFKSFVHSEYLKIAIEQDEVVDEKAFELATIGIKDQKGYQKLFSRALYALIENENTRPSKMVWACENLLRINPNHLGRDGINLKRAIAESKLLRLGSQEKLVTQVLKN